MALEGEHGGEGDRVVDHDGVLHRSHQQVAAVAEESDPALPDGELVEEAHVVCNNRWAGAMV